MAKKVTIGIAITIVAILLCYYLSLVIIFNVELKKEFIEQERRIEQLLASDKTPVNEADFANFELEGSTLKLNQIQVLATHNSYKTMPNMYISYPMNLLFGQKVRNGWYEMAPLIEQLDQGYRGLELDVNPYGDSFILMHDSITDWRTNGRDFELALKEIKFWSDTNPGHAPLHIMLQVRNAFCPYSLKFKFFNPERLKGLDALIADTLGDKVITPCSVKGDYPTLQQAVLANAWPTVGDSLGKIYFTTLFDQPKVKDMYVELDPSFASQQSFVYFRPSEKLEDYAAIILADDPLGAGLAELIEQNYIIRTRIDEQFDHSNERFWGAINLGASIMSTDYPIGNLYDDDYVCKLTPDFKTIIQVGSLTAS